MAYPETISERVEACESNKEKCFIHLEQLEAELDQMALGRRWEAQAKIAEVRARIYATELEHGIV